jgi:NADH-quinone oxidoreductase subunit N
MWNNIIWLTPEIFLSVVTVNLLGFGVIYSKLNGEISQQKKITWLSIFTLLGTLFQVVGQYSFMPTFGVVYITENALFGVDSTIISIKIAILLGSMAILVMSLSSYSAQGNQVCFLNKKQSPGFEFTQLVLLSTLGMLLLISSKDLISLYLSIELISLSLYILASINREGQFSTEAGIKYFLLGSVASGVLLLGSTLIYWLTGETSFIGISNYIWYEPLLEDNVKNIVSLSIASMFIVVALLFKLAAAPFHVWAPDVYEGSPTIVTSYFAIVPKIATLGLLIELIIGPFSSIFNELQPFIIVSAIFSIFIGSLGAINQSKLKRLVAYSAIAHMGFMLIGVSTGAINGIMATFIYILIYMVTSLNTFTFILSLNSPIYISQLAGLSRLNPTLAYTFCLTLFSMAGIPPLAGFISKYLILLSAIENNLYFVATLAIVLSVIGSFYYLRLIKWIFFKDSNDFQYKLLSDIAQGFTTDKNVSNVSTNFPISLINSLILGSTLFILLTFILFPNILINVVFTSFTTTLF